MFRKALWFSLLAVTALVLPARAETADTAGAEKLGWKLTLQSWTVHETVSHSIDIAKEIGVKYIEIYPGQDLGVGDKAGKWGPEMTDEQIKAVLEKAKSADVQIIDTGVIGIPGDEAGAHKFFSWAKKLGITTVIAEPDPKDLPMLDKVAGEMGINVALHDHPKPSRYWDPEFTYEQIKDLKHIGYCADVGHWKRSGLDPVEVLKKHGDRVFSLHFKDLAPGGGSDGLHDVPWGTGQSKAAEMLAVLKEKGFKGPIAIEYEWKWDVAILRQCVDFFNKQANELAGK